MDESGGVRGRRSLRQGRVDPDVADGARESLVVVGMSGEDGVRPDARSCAGGVDVGKA